MEVDFYGEVFSLLTCKMVDSELHPLEVRNCFYIGVDKSFCVYASFWHPNSCRVVFSLRSLADPDKILASTVLDLPESKDNVRVAVCVIEIHQTGRRLLGKWIIDFDINGENEGQCEVEIKDFTYIKNAPYNSSIAGISRFDTLV